MNLNDLTTEEIKGLLNVQKVLNALLDKINNVEIQITHNREQIDTLTKTVNDLSNKVMSMDISTSNELKQLKGDNIPINQKLFNIDKQLGTLSKVVSELDDYLAFITDNSDEEEESKEDTKKKNNSVNKSIKDLKKINKK